MSPSIRPVIAVIGNKNTGKTRVIETLIKELSSRGYTVAAIKHIPDPNFTIDHKGKDTWRYAEAGAVTIISVSPKEIAIIRKVENGDDSLWRIISECEGSNIILLEGFKDIVGGDPRVMKIVTVSNVKEIYAASERFTPILAYVGFGYLGDVPDRSLYIDLPREGERLINIIVEKIEECKSRLKMEEKVEVTVDGRRVPCVRFVQEIISRTVLGMLSSLKGVDIRGDEKVRISVESGD